MFIQKEIKGNNLNFPSLGSRHKYREAKNCEKWSFFFTTLHILKQFT